MLGSDADPVSSDYSTLLMLLLLLLLLLRIPVASCRSSSVANWSAAKHGLMLLLMSFTGLLNDTPLPTLPASFLGTWTSIISYAPLAWTCYKENRSNKLSNCLAGQGFCLPATLSTSEPVTDTGLDGGPGQCIAPMNGISNRKWRERRW